MKADKVKNLRRNRGTKEPWVATVLPIKSPRGADVPGCPSRGRRGTVFARGMKMESCGRFESISDVGHRVYEIVAGGNIEKYL